MWVNIWERAQRWVPRGLDEHDDRRARVLVMIAWFIAPWGLAIGAALFALGAHIAGVAIALIGPIGLLVPVLVRRSKNLIFASNVLLIALFQALFIATARLGGVASPPVLWWVLIPVISTATATVRAGQAWTAVLIAGAFAIHAYQFLGWVETPFVEDPGWDVLGTASSVGLYLLMGLFLWANDRGYQRLLSRTHDAELKQREANQAKSSFLANMSHEIRTPLNAILGYTEMLAEDAEELGHTQTLADLGRVQRSGTHLLRLVNDILDLSKIEAGRLELVLEPIQLDVLVANVVREVEVLSSARGNRLLVDLEPAWVLADRARLRQCVFNLLSNAVKFTENGEIRALTRRDSVTISDSGIGMTPEQLDRVFEPFAQAKATTSRDHGGTGLGLPIVERLVALMHGQLQVQSKPGIGSTFTITFPQTDPAHPAQTPQQPPR